MQCIPAPTGYVYINKQNGGTISIIRNCDFPSLCSNKECKRDEKSRHFLISWIGGHLSLLCPTTEEKNGLLPQSQGPMTCIE
jgi:hypothetical protein